MLTRRRQLRKRRSKVSHFESRATSPLVRLLRIEDLEQRRLLTYYDDIAERVAGPTGALANISSGLKTVNAVTSLPIINKRITEIDALTTSLDDFRTKLYTTVKSLSPATAEATVKTVIADQLRSLNILADRSLDGRIDGDDIAITAFGTPNMRITMDLSKTFNTSSTIGLGVDGIPFKPISDPGNPLNDKGNFGVKLAYTNFTIGLENDQPYFDTSAANELQFTLSGSFPSNISVGLGFLQANVTDLTTAPDLNLTFSVDVGPSFVLSNPSIGGNVDLQLHLEAEISQDMPKVQTDFIFQWTIPSVQVNQPLGASWGAPRLEFRNVQLDIGSVLGSIVNPIAERAQEIFEPMQPIFDLMQQRLPVISDFSEEFGGPSVDFVFMSQALSALPNPPTEFLNVIHAVERLRNMSEMANSLAGRGAGTWIDVGDFVISAPPGNTLLNMVPAKLGQEVAKWSELVFSGGQLNLDGLKQAVRAALSEIDPSLAEQINGLWESVSGESQGNGLQIKFPVAEDPSGTALRFLLGQESELVNLTANFQLSIDKFFSVLPIPILKVGIAAQGSFTAYAQIGYDTIGLRDAIAPLYAGRGFDPSKIFNGFYIDKATRLAGDAKITLRGGVGFESVAEASVGAGLATDVLMTLANPRNQDKIRPTKGDLDQTLFHVRGHIDAVADLRVKAGFELFGEWIGIDKTWNFGRAEIFSFDTSTISVPPILKPQQLVKPVLARYVPATRSLILNAGADAYLRGPSFASITDERFTVRRLNIGSGVFVVSAFGYSSRFTEPIALVEAAMGDGKDNLRVLDAGSSVFYILDGGEGDDSIDVDGQVDVYVQGGQGNDKLDGGSGRNRIQVLGGPGVNTISIADGDLRSVIAPDIFLDPGAFATLTIDNSDDPRAYNYSFVDDLNSNLWTMTVAAQGADTFSRTLSFNRMRVKIYAGSGDDRFLGPLPNLSSVYAGGGDDSWDITNGSEYLSDVGYPMNFYGGPGLNTLTIQDSLSTVNSLKLSSNSAGELVNLIRWNDQSNSAIVLQSTDVKIRSGREVQIRSWAGGNIDVEAPFVTFDASEYQFAGPLVTVLNTPTIAVIDYPRADNTWSPYASPVGIDRLGPYFGTPGSVRTRINYDSTLQQFDYFGSDLTIDPNVLLASRPLNVLFGGNLGKPNGSNWLRVHSDDPTNPSISNLIYDFDITSSRFKLNEFSINTSGITDYEIYGGNQADTLRTAVINAEVNFYGGEGRDISIVAADNLTQGVAIWEVLHNRVTASSLLANISLFDLRSSDVENVELRTSAVKDNFLFSGALTQQIAVIDAGGDDIYNIESLARILGSLYIAAGEGNDTFGWQRATNGLIEDTRSVTYPVLLDGGPGYNALGIDELRQTAPSDYVLLVERFMRHQADGDRWIDFNFQNMSAIVLTLGPNDDNVSIQSVPSSISDTNQVTIFGNGGNDRFQIRTHDNEAVPTINGNLGIDGGEGVDLVTIDDSSANFPLTYSFLNYFTPTTLNVFLDGRGTLGIGSTVENLDVNSGSANDVFRLQQIQSSTPVLRINAGDGDDQFTIAPTTSDLDQVFLEPSRTVLDGDDGQDSLTVDNSLGSTPWNYRIDNQLVRLVKRADGYRADVTVPSIEEHVYLGGLAADQIDINALLPGTSFFADAGVGNDTFTVTQARGRSQEIQGRLTLDGGIDGANLLIWDQLNTAGTTVHINPSSDGTIGNYAGDTLWGIGGSLRMRRIQDTADSTGLVLSLGSGNDQIYATPLALTSTYIFANDPTTAGADQLYLALQSAQNPTVTTNTDGTGRVTSSNRKDLNWSGIELVRSDYVEPNGFHVTNTLDSGPGSLRQAILDANATANTLDPDIITFDLPGRSNHSIQLAAALPAISDPVVLDATTQPGYIGQPIIELDGSNVRDHGLVLLSGGNTIRGLAINRFVAAASAGIWIAGPGGNRIQGNFIGTNLVGDAIYPVNQQQSYGIVVFGSDSNTIGTDGNGVNDAWEGNLLSGQSAAGVLLVSGQPGALPDDNIIAGNRIGTSADGRSALGNGRMGVFYLGAGSGNRIGTNSDGVSDALERNIISGNNEAGLYVTGNNSLIAGNFIGTDIDGVRPLPNGDGIVLSSSSGNSIGGTLAASANVIAFNRYSGINVTSGTNNSILGNSIFQNDRLGINLSSATDPANFVTPNDDRDQDAGANNLQNYPVLSQVLISNGQTIIGGSLVSSASKSYRVEFFANTTHDPSGYGEGQRFLGFVDVNTNLRGQASFTFTTAALEAGQFVTATATDNLGNTSEFALSKPANLATSLTNVAILQLPGGGTVILTAPTGSSLTASVKTTASAPPPSALSFSSGYFDIQLTGIAPGAAADVIVTGLNLPQVRGYYLYGQPASNRSTQWYSFDLQNGNAGGNSAGTGAEIIGGNLVLHLIDGKRGDSNLRADGTISLFGGATFNRAPKTVDDTFTTAEDTVLVISGSSLRRNDSDADGDQLTILLVGAAVGGSVSLNNDVIRFVPQADYFGPASFKYTLSDGSLTTIGRVLINVTEVNDTPIANPDRVTLLKDTSRVEIDVLRNDIRGPANEFRQTLTVISAEATVGSVSIRPDGGLVYRPRENFFGTDTIRYRIEDNGRTAGRADPRRATGTVTVTINSINDLPIATDQSLTVSDQGRVTLSLRGSDVETPLRNLVFTLTALPTQGTVQTENGSVVNVGDRFTGPVNLIYQPGLIFDGSQADSVKFRVSDDASPTAGSDEGEITIGSAMRSASANLDSSGILRIAGTNHNDDIKVTRSGDRTLIYLNQQLIADRISWSNVREIRVWAREGDDTVDLSAVDVPTVIVGGKGSDILRGGHNADLIFGGLGEDQLFDNRGDDVLLGNQLNATVTMDFARQVLSQWRTRRATNDAFRASIVDDLVKDVLRDGEGDDWALLASRDVRFDDARSDRDVVTS